MYHMNNTESIEMVIEAYMWKRPFKPLKSIICSVQESKLKHSQQMLSSRRLAKGNPLTISDEEDRGGKSKLKK